MLCTVFSLQRFNIKIFLPSYLKGTNFRKDKKKKKTTPQGIELLVKTIVLLCHENI